MTQKIKLPSKEEFTNLYITDNLSIQEMAEHYNVGRSTIDNWIKTFQIIKPKELIKQCKERTNLKKFGYTNVALIPGYRKKTHFSIPMPSYEDFYKYYITDNLRRSELSKLYKVGKATIDKWISILQIKKSQELINKSIQNYMFKTYNVNNISQVEEIKQKKEQTFIERFGVKTTLQLDRVREQQKEIVKQKYGEKGVLGNEQIKATIKESIQNKYGVDNVMQLQSSKDKRIVTNKEKYGKDYYAQTEESKEKIKNTCLKKYGTDNYFKTEEFEKKKTDTIIAKYGVNNYSKTQEFKNFIKEHHDEIEQKKKQTNIDRFGVDSFFKTKEHKEFIKEYMKEYYIDIQKKIYESKKKNNSFNKSKGEDQVYQELLKKFKKEDIVRQYRSEKYPFNCDFYIKSIDLYIECHFSQFHNFRTFNPNNSEHIKELKILQNKAKEINFKGVLKNQYNMIIKVWTKADPLKLQTFINNKLNYQIFYTIEEFKQWYNTI